MTPQATSGQRKEWMEGITQVLTCQPVNKPRVSITARSRGVQERTVGYRVQEGRQPRRMGRGPRHGGVQGHRM